MFGSKHEYSLSYLLLVQQVNNWSCFLVWCTTIINSVAVQTFFVYPLVQKSRNCYMLLFSIFIDVFGFGSNTIESLFFWLTQIIMFDCEISMQYSFSCFKTNYLVTANFVLFYFLVQWINKHYYVVVDLNSITCGCKTSIVILRWQHILLFKMKWL